MMCNCESKKILCEYEIKCERLLFKLKEYETEINALKSIEDQTRNNERQTIQSLNDQLDSILYYSNLDQSENFSKMIINIIELLSSGLMNLTIKKLPIPNLNRLIQKLKEKNEAISQQRPTKIMSSCDQLKQEKTEQQLKLADKEIFTLKKKLKQTKFELDSIKLKLNNPTMLNIPFNCNQSQQQHHQQISAFEIDDLKTKTESLKYMLDEQNMIIKTLFESMSIEYTDKISKSKVVASCSPASSASNSTYSSVSSSSNGKSTNNESSSDSNNLNNKNKNHNLNIYLCPKCNTAFDSNLITTKRFENHVSECDAANKLVCVFCTKLFDKHQQNQYENHTQTHLAKTSLTKSPTTTVSSTDYFFLNNYENKISSSTSASGANTPTTTTTTTSASKNSTLLSNSSSLSKNSNKPLLALNNSNTTSANISTTSISGSVTSSKSADTSNLRQKSVINDDQYLDLNNNNNEEVSNNDNILISEFHPRTRKRL